MLKVVDADGNTVTSGVGYENPLRYRGYYYDWESGFYYLNSRYYDPEIGRFISPEPNVSRGMFDANAGLLAHNVYAYCANNPVIFLDATGNFIFSTLLICVVAGAVIGGTVGGIAGNAYADSKGYSGRDKTKAILTGIGIGGLAGGALGYFAAPAVVSATGVTGVSVTSAGISAVTASTLLVPEYVRNAGSFIRWLSNSFQRTKQVINLQQVKQLFSLAREYGVKITADLSGHPNSDWPMPHLHFGDSRVHIAIAEEAINWIIKHIK